MTIGFSLSLLTLPGSAAGDDTEGSKESGSATALVTQAVEEDMHEFMEYYFQPTYRRLKSTMNSAPADNAGWKAIKADALTLAEGGNLLLDRPSDEDAKAWKQLSIEVRKAGQEMYQAAKKKDFEASKASYGAMLKQCNACHDKFAGGEHQLAP
ncbi:MAG: cytochrome c [Planctomycetales bacterium]|nr:cytochrome c [Planctomycetales bacterium]